MFTVIDQVLGYDNQWKNDYVAERNTLEEAEKTLAYLERSTWNHRVWIDGVTEPVVTSAKF